MKKLFLACIIGVSGIILASGQSSAAQNAMHSKYCMTATYDPLCMSPKMMHMRMMMMKMTKVKVMANRSMYCQGASNSSDPICEPKMMNNTMGY